MSLTKLLPTPSDRMGLLWNLLALSDACILEYGPAGTTHYGLGLIGDLDLKTDNRYFVSHMTETDVVMGNSKNLEKAVREIDLTYKPKHIFVVGSSVSTTIGADLNGICHYLQRDVQARLHVHNTGGFGGNYRVGTEAVYRLLADLVEEIPLNSPPVTTGTNLTAGLSSIAADAVPISATPPEHKLTYNLLGFSPDHFRSLSDLFEVQRLLKEGLNLEPASSFTINGAIDKLPMAASADISLVLRPEALPLAQALQARFNIPYLEPNFYGYHPCLAALQAIATQLDITVNASVENHLNARIKRCAMLPYILRRATAPVLLYSVAHGEVNANLAAALEPLGLHFTTQLESTAPEAERLAAIATWSNGLIFADQESLDLASANNSKVLISFPWYSTQVLATHLPFMGSRGMDFILEQVYAYLIKERIM